MASGFRALIVDDDLSMQRLGSHALRQHGFQCITASDVREAKERLAEGHFDVIVTDLRLPQKNGYSLVLELLGAPDRSIIVVCTDVIDARLTKDLMMRGVDDIFAKPVHGAFFAGKIRALLDVKLTLKTARPAAVQDNTIAMEAAAEDVSEPRLPICLNQLHGKLVSIPDVLPISDAALDVAEMTRSCECSVSQIAAAIQRDAALTATVLRLANSPLYNHGGRQILQLDSAVLMIGQQRLGELALATSAMAGVTEEKLPWLNLDTTWRRSMAAGIAMERLIEAGNHQAVEDGLCLSAIMHPLGRVALGMLFPSEYQEMVDRSRGTGESLNEQEKRALPTTHAQVLAHMLAAWNVSPEVFLPIKFAFDETSSLKRLAEPLRTKAELLKQAILLSRLAVGGWHDWDLLELPDAGTLKRLRIADPLAIVEQTKADVRKLVEFSPRAKASSPSSLKTKCDLKRIHYIRPDVASSDFLLPLLSSLGLEAITVDGGADADLPVVLNALNISAKQARKLFADRNAILITNADRMDSLTQFPCNASLPISCGRLRDAIATTPAAPSVPSLPKATSWLGKVLSARSAWTAGTATSPCAQLVYNAT